MDKLKVLKDVFGYSSFRDGQEEIIDSILEGRDVFGIMPTGGGKSICFQVPALMLEGITLVVSPLISLMKDQVATLVQSGVRAAYLNSSLTFRQYNKALENAYNGVYKIIYVAPERLCTPEFLRFANTVNISMVTVDEAHCVSQWGQDFRPGYLKISQFLNSLDRRPRVNAFTATATDRVKKDIIKLLELNKPYMVKTDFDRPNLYFAVESPKSRKKAVLDFVAEHEDSCGVIYCLSRKNVEEICELLCVNGFNATRYHAGLEPEERKQNQEDFIYDRKNIIVATNAFGMGIDKGDVRYVLHYNMPASMEAYYQEAGRAGRDGDKSECVLFYSPQDVRVQQFLIDQDNENEELTEEEQKIVKERQREKLKEMTFYATTDDCLRAYMLRYFGEKAKGKCDNCSNCKGEYDTYDVTRIARSVIRCINDLDERYGTTAICEVLTGLETDRVIRNGLDDEISFGLLYDVEISEIRNVINYLVREEYITQTDGKYPILTLNHKAREFMKKDVKVNVKVRKKNTVKPKFVREKTADSNLFELLRQCRMKIAQQKRVPAFMIFTDASLRDMTVKQPTIEKEFLTVSGVGSAKMKAYGKEFMNVIKQYKNR